MAEEGEGDTYHRLVIDLRTIADEVEAESDVIDRITTELQDRLDVSRSHGPASEAPVRDGFETGLELAIAVVRRQVQQAALRRLTTSQVNGE